MSVGLKYVGMQTFQMANSPSMPSIVNILFVLVCMWQAILLGSPCSKF